MSERKVNGGFGSSTTKSNSKPNPLTKNIPGINFSTLARNASKYYNTKIIGMENVSPEVSPIKSKLRIPLNNLLAFKKSPKWLRSSDSKPDFTPTLRSSKSEFPTLREIQNEEKESIPKTEKLTAQTRQISAETQDTNITWSNIESHLEKISRPPSTKNEQWEKSMNNVEPLSPFSRNMSEYQAQSYFSRPFSADVGTIPECEESCNLNLGEDSYENPLNEDLNHIG